MWLTSRCVTGMPAAAGTEMALVTPEMTRTGTPAATQDGDFLAAAAEDVRVAALEPHHVVARQRGCRP